jgi:hypothetical protein
MKPTYVFAIAVVLLILVPALVKAQSPPIPDKAPQALAAPSKAQPFASPQAALASPQQAYAPQQALAPQYAPVVLQAAPQVFAIQRQVVLQAAPVMSYQTVQAAFAPVAYDTGCVAQQAVVQRGLIQHSAVVNHGVLHSAQVNHGLVGAGAEVGRQPKKIVTKQVTRVKRGLFGR